MVGVIEALAVLFIVLVNSVLSALLTRFFRVRLHTAWGGLLYSLLLCPVAMVVVFLLLSVAFALAGIEPNLGSRAVALTTTVGIPLAVGLTFDYFWMPAPEEVELPETTS